MDNVHLVQAVSGFHPSSYRLGTGGLSPWLKQQGREADHSPSATAEVKKTWIYTSTPYVTSWRISWHSFSFHVMKKACRVDAA
jgi:hypothetical protein